MSGTMRDEILRRRSEIETLVRQSAAHHPRLFGSVARGEDGPDSDVDLLVEAGPGCSLLDLAGLELELAELFGRPFDVRTLAEFHPRLRPTVLREAIAL